MKNFNQPRLDYLHPSQLFNVQVNGIDTRDYPDFADAYIVYAETKTGRPLTEIELDYVTEKYSDFVYELAIDSVF